MSKGSNTTRTSGAATTRSSSTNGARININRSVDRILNNDSLSENRFVTVKAPDGVVQVEHFPRRYGGGRIVIHTSPNNSAATEKELTYKGDKVNARNRLEDFLRRSIQKLGGNV